MVLTNQEIMLVGMLRVKTKEDSGSVYHFIGIILLSRHRSFIIPVENALQ